VTRPVTPSVKPPERGAHAAPTAAEGARGTDGQPEGGERISLLEWLVALVGLIFVVGTVAFLVIDATRGEGTLPRLEVRADSVVALGDLGYLVPFTATNRGHATAADVSVVGELRDAAGVETSRARVDYVPGRSEQRGGLLFRRDPRRAALRLWAQGFQEP